ncbi:MAG: hypothetical protein Q9182_002191 [Xanthomendoza sp. 2 TL-2023]
MPVTRGSNGITAPRVPFVPTSDPQSRQTKTTRNPTTKKKSTSAKANISKPRAGKASATATAPGAGDKTATGRVAKAKAAPKAKKTAPKTKTVDKRETGLFDKVVGVKDIIVGTLEGKPGKKAAGTKKIRGTDGKGATRGKKK